MKIRNLTVLAEADAIAAACDSGAGAAKLQIWDANGAGVPADADTAITTQLLLAEITLNDPSFAAAVDVAPGGRIVLDVTPVPEDAAANATAVTATLFARIVTSTGTCIVQFDTVGVGSGEVQINTLSIVINSVVQVTSGQITVPEG